MKIRNLLLCILILLTFLTVVVDAQVDINRLQNGKRGFGFGYKQGYEQRFEEGLGLQRFKFGSRSSPDELPIHNILFTGENGFTESIKGTGQSRISFSEEVFDVMLLELRSQIMHIDSLNSPSYGSDGANFGYFLLGGIDIAYLYIAEATQEVTIYRTDTVTLTEYGDTTVEVNSNLYGVNFFAGGGLYATFGPLKPFLHYTFNHSRIFEKLGGKTENYHTFSTGIHFNLSDSVSLMGRAVWPVTSKGFFDPVFEVGINFGSGKKVKPTTVETPTRTRSTRTTPTRTTPTKTTPTRTTPGLDKKVEQPPVETPTTPESYRYKKNDILLVKVKDYIYFAKVSEDTRTTAKDIPVQFFIEDVHVIAGRSVLLDAVHAKREKPKDGWGSQKVTIEYYDGTAWKKMSDVLVFEDFYLLPETAPGERRIGLDKIRIANPSY